MLEVPSIGCCWSFLSQRLDSLFYLFLFVYNSKIGFDFFKESILYLEYLDSGILYFLFVNFSPKVNIVKVIFKEPLDLIYSFSFK